MPQPLKPCPFCGESDTGVVQEYDEHGGYFAFARCNNCSARGPEVDGAVLNPDAMAVREWNNRQSINPNQEV